MNTSTSNSAGTPGLSRRSFLFGGAAFSAAFAAGSLFGCGQPAAAGNNADASGSSDDALASTGENAAATTSPDREASVSETQSCDIVVVGAGASGLTAAIEAAEGGASVILLESQPNCGGNSQIVLGIMGVDSPLTQKLGITVDPRSIINREVKTFNYGVDALLWKDLVHRSGENVQWLMDHGVQFNEAVTNMGQIGGPEVFHTWKEGTTLAQPLQTSAESLGVTIITDTAGEALIMEGDAVAGIYAKKTDGSYLRVDCPAVIIATGGYNKNSGMIFEQTGETSFIGAGFDGHDGSGIKMAVEAGAKDMTASPTFMRYPSCVELDPGLSFVTTRLQEAGTHIWVNTDGERFTDESCTFITGGLRQVATATQQAGTYTLFGSEFFGSLSDELTNEIVEEDLQGTPIQDFLDSTANQEGISMWRADTLEEMANLAGMDAATLVATVDAYNAGVAAGEDEFGKDASALVPLKEGPFYMWRNGYSYTSTLGGIHTNRRFEALRADGTPIAGLYAVGVDGCELYKTFYTIDTPGSCNANNVNSGRTAAASALEYLKA